MRTAIIVIACLVAAAVIAFFVWRLVKRRRLIKKIEQETGVKHAHRSFIDWFNAHKPSKRRLIQIYAALLYNANIKGYITGSIYTSATTKYMCVPGLNCYSCPAAVGACPLGALQNALAESNTRAPFYVLGILGIFGVIFARTICGFLCPVGLGQELLYKVRTPKLKKSRVTRVLSYFKYVLLVVLVVAIPLMYAFRDVPLPGFCKYICPAGTIGGAIGLLLHPDNAEMFGMLGGQFVWKFSLLVAFIVCSVFIFRFFCRFFCPLGAIYGFFNRIALLGVRVDKDSCTDCGKCVSVCKMDVKRVGDHECINCGACISACPTKAISFKGSKLLLHKSSAGETLPEAKPLKVTSGTLKLSSDELNTVHADATQNTAASENTVTSPEFENDGKQVGCASAIKARKHRGREFWLQLSVGIVAVIVLIFAFIYYNVIDVAKSDTPNEDLDIGYEVGKTAPDFTVGLIGSDDSFTLYDNRGTLTVVNFWATWCTPCVNEIPYFEELAKNHPEVTVLAIHGSSTQSVSDFIERKGWGDYTLTFAQDNIDGSTCLTYQLLGGKSTWPMTVIIDGEGKVLYNSTQSFHNYEQLEQLVLGFASDSE